MSAPAVDRGRFGEPVAVVAVAYEPVEWGPLEHFSAVVASLHRRPRVDPDDFMFMGAVHLATGVTALGYKHRQTRRTVYLDAAGHAYRYAALAGSGSAWLLPFRDPAAAIAAVCDSDGIHHDARQVSGRAAPSSVPAPGQSVSSEPNLPAL